MRHFSACFKTAVLTVLLIIPFVSELKAELKMPGAFDQLEINGFFELRGGVRTRNDPVEKDISLMEGRLQLELFTYTDSVDFKYKADLYADHVIEQYREYDTREAWVFIRPFGLIDMIIGRQVLTWGTGDLVFINDLFPKDWQSFFIGRDEEYLKAPSDAVKCSFFTQFVSMDFIYTPQFDPDRFITGDYISHWNNSEQRLTGQDFHLASSCPDSWFRDDEISLRIYKNINNYEYAFYAYSGFWKRPAGQNLSGIAVFPKLNVYGASVRGQLGSGIGNLEFGYYDSSDDQSGENPLIDNSELRYLAGYTQEIAKEFNASFQYYVEQMLDYTAYEKKNQFSDRDQLRQVMTLQLTKMMMNQNLTVSLGAYYSPGDQDAYLRPKIKYKYSDYLFLETGANVFFGAEPYTFFAQFEKNTNVYINLRYSF